MLKVNIVCALHFKRLKRLCLICLFIVFMLSRHRKEKQKSVPLKGMKQFDVFTEIENLELCL